jgi:hypothetical protein
MPTAIDPSELQLSIPAIYARLTEVTESRTSVDFITLVEVGSQRSQFQALISPCDLVVLSRIAGFRRLSGTTSRGLAVTQLHHLVTSTLVVCSPYSLPAYHQTLPRLPSFFRPIPHSYPTTTTPASAPATSTPTTKVILTQHLRSLLAGHSPTSAVRKTTATGIPETHSPTIKPNLHLPLHNPTKR